MMTTRDTSVPVGNPAADQRPLAVRFAEATRLIHEFSVEYTAIFDLHLGTSYATNAQIHAVACLVERGSSTTREMSRESGLSRRAAGDFVSLLHDAGTVETSKDHRDRRKTLVTPTPRGRRRLDDLMADLAAFLESSETATRIVEELDRAMGMTDPPTPKATDITDVLKQLSSAGIAANRAYQRRTGQRPVAGNALNAILALAEVPDIRPTQLAAELSLTSGGMSYVINQLEDRGHVLRTYGGREDRRAVHVSLTTGGYETLDAFRAGVGDAAIEIRAAFAAAGNHRQA